MFVDLGVSKEVPALGKEQYAAFILDDLGRFVWVQVSFTGTMLCERQNSFLPLRARTRCLKSLGRMEEASLKVALKIFAIFTGLSGVHNT